MKTTISLVSMLLGLFLVVLLPSKHLTDTSAQKGGMEKADEEKCGCESTSSKEDFPYANHMDPQKYMELYEAVQRMPSEKIIEGPKRKAIRTVNISNMQWESFGPLGVTAKNDPNSNLTFGRIRCMQWYENHSSGLWELYLGASSGHLWYGQPTSGVVTFQSLGDALENPSVGAFAIDPYDHNVIIVGTGDWNRYNGSGVYKTTNRGQSWNKSFVFPYPGAVTHILYLVGNSVMIMSTNKGVFRSTDGGDTFTHMTVEPSDSNAPCYGLVATNAATIYAGLSFRGVYKSANGGFNWTMVPSGGLNGLPTTAGSTIALDYSRSDPAIIYAAYTDTNNNQGGIYKSTDAGQTWFGGNDQPTYISNGQGGHVNVIRVHPQNPDRVYAAGVSMLVTPTGGAGWVELNRTYHGHDDITDIQFYPPDPSKVYICSDGGIIVQDSATLALDNTQISFLPGAPLQVYEMDHAWSESNMIVAGTQDNGNVMTVTGSVPGSRWWEASGCDGGDHISIDPQNSSVFYTNQWCGRHSARVRTQDQGNSYTGIDGGFTDTIPYNALRWSKGGTMVLWTISETGLYYSPDHGNSWLISTQSFGPYIPNPFPGTHRLSVNNWAPASQKSSYMVLDNMVLIAEGTPSMMNVFNPQQSFDRVVPDRWNADWAFGLMPGFVWKSTDRGHSWFDISGSPGPSGIRIPQDIIPYDIVASQQTAKVLYLATNVGMLKSIDGGGGWFKFQDGLPKVVDAQKISYVPGIGEDTLRIGTYGRGFWQRLVDDTDPDSVKTVKQVDGIVLSMSSNGNMIYALGSVGLGHKSTDGGNSWQQLDLGTSHNLNGVAVLADQSVIAVGDTGTALRSTDAGTTWNPTPVPTAGNITGISLTTGGNAWICADDGSILKSITGGIDWIPQANFSGTLLQSCQFINDSYGYVLGHTTVGGSVGIVYFTTNGGDMWTPSYLPGTNNMHKLFFTGDSEGVVVGDSGTVLKTTDAGTTWSTMSTGLSANLYDCFFKDRMNGFACGDSGTLLKTEDGGQTWSRLGTGSQAALRALGLSNTNLLIGGDGMILRSSQVHQNKIFYNLNNNWNLVSLPVEVSDSSVAGLYPSARSPAYLYDGSYTSSASLARGKGFWLKFNGDQVTQIKGTGIASVSVQVAAGWNLIGSLATYLPTAEIQSVPAGMVTSHFFQYTGAYSIATTIEPGKAYWVKVNQAGTLVLSSGTSPVPAHAGKIRIVSTDDQPPPPPDPEISNLKAETPNRFALEQNYPNPFNPITTIRYQVPVDSRVTLTVYDILGQLVATLVDGPQQAGFKSVEWSATSVASGVYMVRLEAEPAGRSPAYRSTRKMVVVK